MPVSKITADQIFLGDSSLKTTKEVFAPNELITSGKCDTIPHDGWEFFFTRQSSFRGLLVDYCLHV